MPAFNISLQSAAYAARDAAAAASPAAAKSGGGFSLDTAFHDLLDIVNPLQHLPIVSTLYRAITGDKIGTVEKIAGDTLYGGVWGAVASVADSAFEAVTGKDFGSTVLAFFSGNHNTAVAAAAPVKTASATPVPSASSPSPAATPALQQGAATADVTALADSLSAKGMNSDLSARALYAYRRSQGLTQQASGLLPLAVN